MEEKPNRSRVLKAAAIGTIILLAGGGLLFVFLREEEPTIPIYTPTTELPGDFIVIADYPDTQEDMLSISCLSPLLFHGGSFHPLLILDQDGYLSRQELYTLSHWKTDRLKLLFSNGEGVLENVNAQLEGEGLEPVQEGMLFPLSGDICGVFFGFDGAITVGSYEESLWTATYAKTKNLAMVKGAPTFQDQEDAWAALGEMGPDVHRPAGVPDHVPGRGPGRQDPAGRHGRCRPGGRHRPDRGVSLLALRREQIQRSVGVNTGRGR